MKFDFEGFVRASHDNCLLLYPSLWLLVPGLSSHIHFAVIPAFEISNRWPVPVNIDLQCSSPLLLSPEVCLIPL